MGLVIFPHGPGHQGVGLRQGATLLQPEPVGFERTDHVLYMLRAVVPDPGSRRRSLKYPGSAYWWAGSHYPDARSGPGPDCLRGTQTGAPYPKLPAIPGPGSGATGASRPADAGRYPGLPLKDFLSARQHKLRHIHGPDLIGPAGQVSGFNTKLSIDCNLV